MHCHTAPLMLKNPPEASLQCWPGGGSSPKHRAADDFPASARIQCKRICYRQTAATADDGKKPLNTWSCQCQMVGGCTRDAPRLSSKVKYPLLPLTIVKRNQVSNA